MFENHVMQMFDTREMEMRARLSQRRVDLVPPLRGNGMGWVAKLAAAFRSRVKRPQVHTRHSTAPSAPWL
jgi:hypothetical protein